MAAAINYYGELEENKENSANEMPEWDCIFIVNFNRGEGAEEAEKEVRKLTDLNYLRVDGASLYGVSFTV